MRNLSNKLENAPGHQSKSKSNDMKYPKIGSSRRIGINSLSVLSHHPAYGSVQGGSLIYTLTFR